MDSQLPDSEVELELYLQDVFLGFDDENNLKMPLKGFTESDANEIIPKVEERSAILFEIMEEMENGLASANITSILSHDKEILIPRTKYLLSGGSGIRLRIFNTKTTQNDKMNSDFNETTCTIDKLAPLLQPFNIGWEREIVMRSELSAIPNASDIVYHTPDNVKLRSSKQVAQYLKTNPSALTMENFWFGKGRISLCNPKETVRTAYVWSPQIVKKRKKSVTHRSKKSEAGNPGMGKKKLDSRQIRAPIRYSTDENAVCPNKIIKMCTKKTARDHCDMEMGMLPPKYPKGREDTSNSSTPLSLSPDSQKVRRRGRPPKPGGKKDLAEDSRAIFKESNDPDNSMFQISAFRQSNLMDAAIEQYHEMQNMEMNSDPENSEGTAGTEEHNVNVPECNQSSGQLFPCSVRCSGMTGKVPTLQCKRCLCLYHPNCLDVPPNLNCIKDFFCANCDDKPPEERLPDDIALQGQNTKQEAEMEISHGSPPETDGVLQPPPLQRGPYFQTILDTLNDIATGLPRLHLPAHAPLHQFQKRRRFILPKPKIPRLETSHLPWPVSKSGDMGIFPLKRTRGRPPKAKDLLFQLSRSLTITPITMWKKLPSIPENVGSSIEPYRSKKSRIRGDSPFSPVTKQRKKHPARLSEPPALIMKKQKELKECSPPLLPPTVFRKIMQSVVIIGQDKFVVIPKIPKPESISMKMLLAPNELKSSSPAFNVKSTNCPTATLLPAAVGVDLAEETGIMTDKISDNTN